LDLRLPDVGRRVQDLPLQVREVDAIGVAERDRADARRRQELRDRRAEPPDADHERVRGRELLLRVGTELVEQDVTAVAEKVRIVHFRYQRSGIRDQYHSGMPAPY